MYACMKGELTIVQTLLAASSDREINVNKKTKNGDSAVVIAAAHNHTAIVQCLLTADAEISLLDIRNPVRYLSYAMDI
jgi:ankyrin repeat protein